LSIPINRQTDGQTDSQTDRTDKTDSHRCKHNLLGRNNKFNNTFPRQPSNIPTTIRIKYDINDNGKLKTTPVSEYRILHTITQRYEPILVTTDVNFYIL